MRTCACIGLRLCESSCGWDPDDTYRRCWSVSPSVEQSETTRHERKVSSENQTSEASTRNGERATSEAAAAALDAAVLEAAAAVVLVVLDAAAAEAEAAAVVAATSSAFGARKINPAATSNTHEIEAIDVTCRSIEVRNFPRAGLERRTGVSSVWIQQERRQRAASSAGLSPLEWIYLAPTLLLRGGQHLRLSHQPLVGRAYAIDRLLGASHLIGWRRSKGRSERQTVKDVSIGVKEYGV